MPLHCLQWEFKVLSGTEGQIGQLMHFRLEEYRY